MERNPPATGLMNSPYAWLTELSTHDGLPSVDGMVSVASFDVSGKTPEEVVAVEHARKYGADAVFFEAPQNDSPPIAQAFIFVDHGGPASDPNFAKTHQRLWSWGGVPLVYRATKGLVQLFRCAHRADFEADGEIKFKPFKTLKLAARISNDPWWNAERIRNGTLWDDPKTCRTLLSGDRASHKSLISEFQSLHRELDQQGILPKRLRRKLLILTLLIAYLEERKAFADGYFGQFLRGATRFFEVLADGPALVTLLEHLEERFNGKVFVLTEDEKARLESSGQLKRFARFVEAKQDASGQLNLWEKYSFADLPVELISHIYQLFVKDTASSVYTPPFLVRLMLGEILSWERLDRLIEQDEVVLDPACGSGVFLIETYKRLIVHWRSRNNWKLPKKTVLQRLVKKVHGIDHEEDAVELAAFSLCLGMCDALEPAELRSTIKLFPELIGKSLHESCFFKAKDEGLIKKKVGIVVGNPPFVSKLTTPHAEVAYSRYQQEVGPLPDKQLAYLFLHESMQVLERGGILCMLQQYNFLYNQQSLEFRREFISRWDVREILDFMSVPGLFKKGKKNTKVLVVAAIAKAPPEDRRVLHATFRQSGRVIAERGFEIDYYDMHWLPRELIASSDDIWRCNLLGGGRTAGFVSRLRGYETLSDIAQRRNWDFGEGYAQGIRKPPRLHEHINGKAFIKASSITDKGIDSERMDCNDRNLDIERARTKARFTPPLLLIRKHMDLACDVWSSYLTYRNEVVGFSAGTCETSATKKVEHRELSSLRDWLRGHKALKAFAAAISDRLFTKRATSLSQEDIFRIPYPDSRDLELSPTEVIVVDDIVDYYRDLVRVGEKSRVMVESGVDLLDKFSATYIRSINAVYKKKPLRVLEPQTWPGIICQPFMFGKGKVDWEGAQSLKGKLDALLSHEQGAGLKVTRIARIYDGDFIFLLKPDRLRYWLRSVALRDADETLADLWDQGF